MKKMMLFLMIVFLISSVIAVCTVTFDKTSYFPTETVTAEMVCTEVAEKSDAYILNWTYQNGTQVELDTGTTPKTVSETFYETYIIPSNWHLGKLVNATLIGDGGTDLEGDDSANVTSAGTNSLLFSNITVGGGWLGLTTSVKAIIKDDAGKKINGGTCRFSSWSNDETTMLASGIAPLFNGQLKFDWILDYESFSESTDYRILLSCYCGGNLSVNACINEDGSTVEYHLGSSSATLTTNSWMTINEDPMPITYENGTSYSNAVVFAGYGEKVFYKANITSNADITTELQINTFLTNNDTGAIFLQPEQNVEVSIDSGNSTVIGRHEIVSNVPTGVYYVTKFYDVVYNNIIVSQGIIKTETFNVTGTDESFVLENVVTDKSNYYSGEAVHVCVNLTNNFNKRVEFKVLYNFRCGSNNLDSDTDRNLVDEHMEYRALSSGTTQNQCASLNAGFSDHLMYKTTQCYASVTIESDYINTFDNKKSITSTNFNLTDFGMYPEYEIDPTYPLVRLFPDWRRFDDVIDNVTRSYFRAKVNITKLNEDWLDPNGVITDNAWDIYSIFSDKMPCSTNIYNYTVEYANGTTIDNPIENKALTWKEKSGEGESHSHCALGIENVNFSDTNDDYFIVKVWFEGLEERATEALEGIESRTGTFHMDVNCPSEGQIGGEMDCLITAQIEESQTVEKEVDFTCYIIENGNIYSSINFNQMVTKTPVTLTQSFPIPSTFNDGSQYVLQCYGDYYNLGKRRDSFYDTFTAKSVVRSGGGGGWKPEEKSSKPGITGGAIDIDGDGDFDFDDIANIFGSRNYVMYFIIFLVIISLIILLVRYKKRKHHTHCNERYVEKSKKPKKSRKDYRKILKQISYFIIIFFIIIGLIFGLI